MNTLKAWLSKEENRRGIPFDQLHMITNELDTYAVSIKGSDIFPITHSLVANVSFNKGSYIYKLIFQIKFLATFISYRSPELRSHILLYAFSNNEHFKI